VNDAKRERLLVEWMSQNIFPHEHLVRRWLKGSLRNGREDDVIQEAYCRLAGLSDPFVIVSPKAYFFQVARSIVLKQIRRDRIVRIECVAEMERLSIVDDAPSPETQVSDREEMAWVAQLINGLPTRRRDIFLMRKVEGMSQRAIAERMNVTENVVEKEIAAGLRVVLKAMSDGARASHPARLAVETDRKRDERSFRKQ
jgi:RNA polymerase sigma factor (sigma-70 family)